MKKKKFHRKKCSVKARHKPIKGAGGGQEPLTRKWARGGAGSGAGLRVTGNRWCWLVYLAISSPLDTSYNSTTGRRRTSSRVGRTTRAGALNRVQLTPRPDRRSPAEIEDAADADNGNVDCIRLSRSRAPTNYFCGKNPKSNLPKLDGDAR
ncbi:hypothetical protein EVAR_54309_1 [Eumeta japonica]|uniref:Uncharacterized protein n=1 Tax=Eumeta variegata TaxID=151549 RepID=A0A4C1Z347_EUMVA|nr:hypothetical protein EVAR_54309_1 [Eumeta japonica]